MSTDAQTPFLGTPLAPLQEVLQPFAVLSVRYRPLLSAVEGHFRSRTKAYAP